MWGRLLTRRGLNLLDSDDYDHLTDPEDPVIDVTHQITPNCATSSTI
jgi:hypothetical protein